MCKNGSTNNSNWTVYIKKVTITYQIRRKELRVISGLCHEGWFLCIWVSEAETVIPQDPQDLRLTL